MDDEMLSFFGWIKHGVYGFFDCFRDSIFIWIMVFLLLGVLLISIAVSFKETISECYFAVLLTAGLSCLVISYIILQYSHYITRKKMEEIYEKEHGRKINLRGF